MSAKRDPLATWRAIEEQAAEADLEEIMAMSDEELDRAIDEAGGDARALRARGEAFAKELLERRARLAWHEAMEQKLEGFRRSASALASREKLPRAELLARLETARQNPRFAAPVATLFQKKTAEASTDEELEALLDEIELLAKLEEE